MVGTLYDANQTFLGSIRLPISGTGSVIVPAPATSNVIVEIYAFRSAVGYTVEVEQVEAHHVQVTFIDQTTLMAESQVEVERDDTHVKDDSDNFGFVDLGYLEPGNYGVHYYKVNRKVSGAPNSAIIPVTTMDVVWPVTMTDDLRDQHEPNNTAATAFPVTLGTPVSGTIGGPTDGVDYFKFNAQAGDAIRVALSMPAASSSVNMRLLDTDGITTLEYVQAQWYSNYSPAPLGNFLDIQIPASGAYYLSLDLSSRGADYNFTISKLN